MFSICLAKINNSSVKSIFFEEKTLTASFLLLFSETLLISRDFNTKSCVYEPFVHTNLIILHAKTRNNEKII